MLWFLMATASEAESQLMYKEIGAMQVKVITLDLVLTAFFPVPAVYIRSPSPIELVFPSRGSSQQLGVACGEALVSCH